jgi:hypothetical protein
MKLAKTATVSVDPDQKHILSATSRIVFLLGHVYDADDSDSRCILTVPRTAYLAAMSKWLDGKAEYGKRTGGFAGVGSIVWDKAKLCKHTHFLMDYEETGNEDDEHDGIVAKRVEVPGYIATDFSVDMEHG